MLRRIIAAIAIITVLLLPSVALAADSCALVVTASGTSNRIGDVSDVEMRVAQSFLAAGTGRLIEFRVLFTTNVGSPTGDIHWELRTASATGTVIGSGTFTPVASAQNSVLVSSGPFLLAGDTYFLVLYADAQATNARFQVTMSSSSVYAGGNVQTSTNAGSSWTNNANGDLDFRITLDGPCSTSTPTTVPATSTPANTATPTITPSPTPNYLIQVTSTAGAPLAIERTATFGDVTVFIGELILAGLIFTAFAYTYWKKK